ncbi:serine protease inhibitor ecotin [Utexia brackfieldae]|uniref:serine protease inhibitor ecotin n=1 Tax=Utexia brackfieldae TaxID=3074108 RepID=UPI00370DB863
MKQIFTVLASCLVLTACSNMAAKNSIPNVNEFAPYPDKPAGYLRSVIYLPQLTDEQASKVELMIGKDMVVDCNTQTLVGNIQQKTLAGWGYSYYTVETTGNAISTLMACPENTGVTKFVTMTAPNMLIDYNSKLPIVVYAPSDLQVKYRVWSANSKQLDAIVQ